MGGVAVVGWSMVVPVGKWEENLVCPEPPRVPVSMLFTGSLASAGSLVNEKVEPYNV